MIRTILLIVLAAIFMSATVSGDTSSVMVVRTNPAGHESPLFAEPLMTYKQGEKLIRQNEEMISLLKDIDKEYEEGIIMRS